jgi:hypothetical protein
MELAAQSKHSVLGDRHSSSLSVRSVRTIASKHAHERAARPVPP